MSYAFDGEKYKLASPHQRSLGKKIISELSLRGDEYILDLGCGDGALTAELAKLVPDGFVLGIDSSESMIETAIKDHTVANLRFELIDINAIDFESEFDLAFSNAALHWVSDHRRLLANVYKSLKVEGRIRFNFAGEGNCANLISILRELISEEDYAEYFDQFEWPWFMPSVKLYSELVDETGFSEKKVLYQSIDKCFESIEAMIKWIDQPSLIPFLPQVAINDRQRFRDTVVERMIARTCRSNGKCYETFRRINLLARK